MSKRKRPKRRGHYCWCCARHRANECFTGKGHRQHLCRECQRFPKVEREFRSAVDDLERLVTDSGIIPKKRRKQFEKFLEHANEDVRNYAKRLEREDRAARGQRMEADEELAWAACREDWDIQTQRMLDDSGETEESLETFESLPWSDRDVPL